MDDGKRLEKKGVDEDSETVRDRVYQVGARYGR